uniref:Uncharacterized protein n=1 Tax=viral metagenome TaxID=1070528 RepID=A0A6C0I362_9ZZZZ
MLKTYRFLLDKDFVETLSTFSKVHQYDDRKSFKDAWTAWTTDPAIQPLIEEESARLTKEGYEGDILDKMFKSARFYFRTKEENNNNSSKGERKEYVGFSQLVLQTIDEHIEEEVEHAKKIQKDSNKKIAISPEEGFQRFYETHKMLIVEEMSATQAQTKEDVALLVKRFKKAYKNRFYKMRLLSKQ